MSNAPSIEMPEEPDRDLYVVCKGSGETFKYAHHGDSEGWVTLIDLHIVSSVYSEWTILPLKWEDFVEARHAYVDSNDARFIILRPVGEV